MQLPSFLHGSRSTVHRKAMAEGRRCARQYQENGSFTLPREMLELGGPRRHRLGQIEPPEPGRNEVVACIHHHDDGIRPELQGHVAQGIASLNDAAGFPHSG